MSKFYHCDVCERFFDEKKELTTAPAFLCVPEEFVCDREDCARPLPPAPTPVHVRTVQPTPPRANHARKAAPRAEGHMRGCPPERDMETGPIVDSSQAEYTASVDQSGTVADMVAYLMARPGEWVPMLYLKRFGSDAVHSRMPEARALIDESLDIDQQQRKWEATGKAHSFYRICARRESTRLLRKQQRDKKQSQMAI